MAIRNSAESGVATIKAPRTSGRIQVTIEPDSASGTGTLTVKAWGADGYEAAYEDGSALTDIDMSARKTYILDGAFRSVKVASDNSGDTFDLVCVSIEA